jgi:hypothetical protein
LDKFSSGVLLAMLLTDLSAASKGAGILPCAPLKSSHGKRQLLFQPLINIRHTPASLIKQAERLNDPGE